jgi:hypothetical protein
MNVERPIFFYTHSKLSARVPLSDSLETADFRFLWDKALQLLQETKFSWFSGPAKSKRLTKNFMVEENRLLSLVSLPKLGSTILDSYDVNFP